jgi:exonuclease VII large subunit
LDEIAGGRFDTPSKVITHIFQLIVHNAENAMHSFMEYIKFAHNICFTVDNELEKIIGTIKNDVSFTVEHFYRAIETNWQLLIENLRRTLITEEHNLEALMREIICQGPETILSKGFAMAISLTGEMITSCKKALENQAFKLTFHDGSLVVKNNCSDVGYDK